MPVLIDDDRSLLLAASAGRNGTLLKVDQLSAEQWEHLRELGQVEISEVLAGVESVRLTPAGYANVAEAEQTLLDPRARQQKAMSLALHILRDRDLAGGGDTFHDQVVAVGETDGFTEDEVRRALLRLHDHHLVAGIKSWQGPRLVRCRITEEGRQVVDIYGGDLEAFLETRRVGDSYFTFNGNVTQSAVGTSPRVERPSLTTITVVNNHEAFDRLREEFRATWGDDAESTELALQAIDDLEHSVTVAERKKHFKLVKWFADKAGTAVLTALVDGVAKYLGL